MICTAIGQGIKGHSGCKVEVLRSEQALVVRKSTMDKCYIPRLKQQAEKQKKYLSNNDLGFIRVPQVLNETSREDYYYFEMEFFLSSDYISYLQTSCKKDIDIIVERLITFIDDNIKKCDQVAIDALKILLVKYNDVKKTISGNEKLGELSPMLFKELDHVFYSLKQPMNIPIGYCHGDLTFSNILFDKSNRNIVLIDFLDSFIETPLQDIVKIRQDTKYNWSLNLYEKKYDKTRILIIMKYIDDKIDMYFKKYAFYNNYYLIFQLMNFVRILQYAQDIKIVCFLERTIYKLCKELKK